jgi:hypothetical protein
MGARNWSQGAGVFLVSSVMTAGIGASGRALAADGTMTSPGALLTGAELDLFTLLSKEALTARGASSRPSAWYRTSGPGAALMDGLVEAFRP